jgi:hypothetical protein
LRDAVLYLLLLTTHHTIKISGGQCPVSSPGLFTINTYLIRKRVGKIASSVGGAEGRNTCQIVHNPFNIFAEPCGHNFRS